MSVLFSAWPILVIAAAAIATTLAWGLTLGIGVAVAGSCVAASWRLGRDANAVGELNHAVARLGAGDFGHRVYLGEFSPLARSLNEASEQLSRRFAALNAESQQLRMILTSMIEGVVGIDADQRIIFANDRAVKLLKLPASAVGRPLWELIRHRELMGLIKRGLDSATPTKGELTLARSVAEHLLVHVARLPGDSPGGAVVVLHDITAIRRLERMRQEFVSNASHELKTPLAVIAACCETLQAGAVDDLDNRDGFLSRIAEQTNRLHALVLDMLSLARIESNDIPIEVSIIDVQAVVEDAVRRHVERAARDSVALIVESTERQPALANVEAMRQILDNLIDNAVKYTPAGGSVRVRWRGDGGTVVVEVEDTGVGIPEADLPRVFERFYRVDKNRSRELGGTGLGLAIVKHLTHAMQGSVNATSRVGGGTTIAIQLRAESSSNLHQISTIDRKTSQ